MPIRFRCAYCNQLMGIAKRKSGTVVRCPTCAGQVIVPNLEEKSPHQPGAMFEGSEIDKMLEGAGGDQPSVIIPTVGGPPAPVAGAGPVGPPRPLVQVADVQLVSPHGNSQGIWLSSTKATVLTVLAVVGLAVAFGAGLLIGMLIRK